MTDARWRHWLETFERRSRRPRPLRLRARDQETRRFQTLPAPELQALLRCLAVFQKIECQIALEAGAARPIWMSDDVSRALKYFMAEEGRHARLLAMLVMGLGGRVLAAGMTERIFALVRRMIGTRLRMLCLAAVEVASIVLYTIFARRLPVGRCRNILREIIRDEKSHLRFHAAVFHAGLGMFNISFLEQPMRLAFRLIWTSVTRAACVVMMLAMRADLRTMNISFTRVWTACTQVASEVEAWVLER